MTTHHAGGRLGHLPDAEVHPHHPVAEATAIAVLTCWAVAGVVLVVIAALRGPMLFAQAAHRRRT